MPYVIYHKQTTKYLRIYTPHRGVGTFRDSFKTAGAARQGLIREVEKGKVEFDDYAICDAAEFHATIEKTETRRGVGPAHSKDFPDIPVNTPWTSGPWSETYWCS